MVLEGSLLRGLEDELCSQNDWPCQHDVEEMALDLTYLSVVCQRAQERLPQTGFPLLRSDWASPLGIVYDAIKRH